MLKFFFLLFFFLVEEQCPLTESLLLLYMLFTSTPFVYHIKLMTILCVWYISKIHVAKSRLCKISQFALVNAIAHFSFDKYYKAQ